MTFFSQERLAAVPGDALGRARRRLKAGWSHPELILRRLRYGRAAFTQVPWNEVQRHVPRGSCIVEAGAADGSDTVLLAEHFPESRILACEPVSRSFTVLRERTMPLERVEALNVALGVAAGTAIMNVARSAESGSADSSSLLDPLLHEEVYPHVKFGETEVVEVMTLDQLASRQGVQPGFLWLDLQGLELAVLESSPEARRACSAIYMEVSRVELYRGMPLFDDVIRRMGVWGFRPVKDQVGATAGNILFAR